jgi:histidyl-tRNA synthetase
MLVMPGTDVPARRPLVFVVWMGEAEFAAALALAAELRGAGIAVQIDYGARRAKAQFKAADAAGASACVIVGADELARGVYSVKSLATGEQFEVPAAELAARVSGLAG